MFSKLLKHEWKANAGLLGILSACALGAGLLAAFALKGILYITEQLTQEAVAAWGIPSLSSAFMFLCLALVAYGFAVQFINLFRFYKNKFTDEGYLTFTLPVSARQIFLSSFLNMLAWLVISMLVLAAAVNMIVFIGAMPAIEEYMQQWGVSFQDMFGLMEEEWAEEPGYTACMVLNMISTVITPVYSLVFLMTSITVGSVLAKKHKILATIGAYYCINFGVNIAESVLSAVPDILSGFENGRSAYVYLSISVAISILLRIALSIGGYFLSTHLMKHKLNLP